MHTVSSLQRNSGIQKSAPIIKYLYRTIKESDLETLNKKIRDIDRQEVEVACNQSLSECLKDSIKYKNTKVVTVNDKAVAVFGCVNGYPWFLASDEAFYNKTKFLKQSAHIVTCWLKEFNYIHNFVHIENKKAVKWLKFLGFQFHETVNVRGHDFIHFSKSSK